MPAGQELQATRLVTAVYICLDRCYRSWRTAPLHQRTKRRGIKHKEPKSPAAGLEQEQEKRKEEEGRGRHKVSP